MASPYGAMQASPYDDFLSMGGQQLPYFQTQNTPTHFNQPAQPPILPQAPLYPMHRVYDWEYAAQTFIEEIRALAQHMNMTKQQLQQEARTLQSRRLKLLEERERWNEVHLRKRSEEGDGEGQLEAST